MIKRTFAKANNDRLKRGAESQEESFAPGARPKASSQKQDPLLKTRQGFGIKGWNVEDARKK